MQYGTCLVAKYPSKSVVHHLPPLLLVLTSRADNVVPLNEHLPLPPYLLRRSRKMRTENLRKHYT